MNVLITGCGRHSKEIVDCLKRNEDGEPVRVIGIDCSAQNILRTSVDEFFIVPPITDESYLDIVLSICHRCDIDIIIPYITSELMLMAKNRDMFEREGIKVSVSSPESLSIVNDKIELWRVFHDFMPEQAIAKTAEDVYSFAKATNYGRENRFCCKLSNKCGGAGFAIVDDKMAVDITTFNRLGVNRYIKMEQLAEIADTQDINIILQRYVDGTDYSVSVLADHGENVHKIGFAGYAMEYGAVKSGEILKNDSAYSIADTIVRETGFDGNACFDFIIDSFDKPWLLEINPRFHATMPFLARAGVNLAYLRCKQLMGKDISSQANIDYGLKMGKYYESYYYRSDLQHIRYVQKTQ